MIQLASMFLYNFIKRKRIFVLVLFVVSSAISNYANAIDIIANPSLDTKTLTTRELRAVFSLRLKRWSNGLPITVVALNNETDLHRIFCKKILRIFPHQLKLGWDRVTFSGLGQSPVIVKTQKEMIETIISIPGAIGYIDSNKFNDEQSIKKMRLDDK